MTELYRIECEGSPHAPEGLVFFSKYVAPAIERSIEFRGGIIVSEVFHTYDLDPKTSILRAKYFGLRRSGKLMGLTEQKLLPSRFPV